MILISNLRYTLYRADIFYCNNEHALNYIFSMNLGWAIIPTAINNFQIHNQSKRLIKIRKPFTSKLQHLYNIPYTEEYDDIVYNVVKYLTHLCYNAFRVFIFSIFLTLQDKLVVCWFIIGRVKIAFFLQRFFIGKFLQLLTL